MDDVNLLLKHMNEFKIKIILVNKLGEFWAQLEDNQHLLDKIERLLNLKHNKLNTLNRNALKVNQLVVTVHFSEDRTPTLTRAKILQIKPNCVNVFYIDYGNTEDKDFKLLFEIYDEIKDIPHQVTVCKCLLVVE